MYRFRIIQLCAGIAAVSQNVLAPSRLYLSRGEKETTENKTTAFPKTASVLALVGSTLIVICGALLTWVSMAILPHVSFPYVNHPQLAPGSIPAIASGVVAGIGLFGLVSGAIVLASAVLLIAVPSQWKAWGVLMLVFSALSILGLGGFLVGAILGVAGGILTLRWNPSAA